MEEDDSGGSVCARRRSWWFELKAVATRRGCRGEAFDQLRRSWKGVDGGGDGKLGGGVREQSRAVVRERGGKMGERCSCLASTRRIRSRVRRFGSLWSGGDGEQWWRGR
jgi:hypothetical protein